jgi:hypothetical protein
MVDDHQYVSSIKAEQGQHMRHSVFAYIRIASSHTFDGRIGDGCFVMCCLPWISIHRIPVFVTLVGARVRDVLCCC